MVKRIVTALITILVSADNDDDGMPDNWGVLYGLNTSFDDSLLDPDQDGANNMDEYSFGTNPVVWEPVLRPLRNITVNETQTVRIWPQVSNPDNIPLQFTIDSPVFTWNGYYFSWRTNEHSSGEYLFTVTVTDGTTSDFQQVRVIVNNTCRVFNKKL